MHTREEHARLAEEIEELREKLVASEAPVGAAGAAAVPLPEFKSFVDLPFCERTKMGLERGNYTAMTIIQSQAIPWALTGHDILAAAKTGSGKTLAFLVPTLERLVMEKWDGEMGVGALVLSPTRELALQIFKVLQVIGYKHVFSAALLTGGRNVEEEKKRLSAMSIVIATPGRLCQHLREGSQLSLDNLQVLVMDEADRLLDMGFRKDIDTVLEHVPSSRQTMLFSATQTSDVGLLARMSLKNPKYISAHANTTAPTPSRMCQNFIVLDLHRKLDALLTFIKRHPNDKTVVFVSTCNQVKFMYLAFSKILKKLRVPSMCLTGKMKQFRREEVFLTFCRCKSAVLFCTDIAARGLDFPMVHYVIQYDCPDSAQTYVHRAGRTARAGARGVNILFLTPSEVPMLSYLDSKRIPLREIKIRPHLLTDNHELFVALVVQGLKYDAQKAFIAYMRSVYFAANKLVFNLKSINLEAFAKSLGLLVVPNMGDMDTFHRGAKNLPWDVVNYMSQAAGGGKSEAAAAMTKKEKHLTASDMFKQLQIKQRFAVKNDESESDDDILFKKVTPSSEAVAAPPALKATRTSATTTKFDDDEDEEAEATAPGSSSNKLGLTFEERMAGLSKNKQKKLLHHLAPDIRVKDLGLSKVTVFGDDDDEAAVVPAGSGRGHRSGAEDLDFQQRIAGLINSEKAKTRADKEAKRRRGEEVSEAEDGSSEDYSSEGEFANKMSSFIQSRNSLDKAKVRDIRRQRRLKKEGKLPVEGIDRRADKKDDDDDEGAYYDDDASSDDDNTEYMGNIPKALGTKRGRRVENSDDDSEGDNDGGLAALLKAARGELYEKDENVKYKETEELDEDAADMATHFEDVRQATRRTAPATKKGRRTTK